MAETYRMSPETRELVENLEVKDAQVIFTNVWNELEAEKGRENMTFSKELILLGGAPGSGKGTHTQFIMRARDLTCPPIVVSSLLNTPEAEKIKEAGGMVGDREVVELVFRKLLEPEYRDGCVLDGFPRTQVQVECLKMLVQKMNSLYRLYHRTPLAANFRKPTIHVMVLFVDEQTSIERQLKRGKEIADLNARAEAEGDPPPYQERATDKDPEAARHRYRVFKEKTWEALQSLKEVFHYHFVDAQGEIESVEKNILKELEYQSSLELDPDTYDSVRHLPLAGDLAVHARQELVKRMDGYQLDHCELFQSVIKLIEERFMPIVTRHAIPGLAIVNSEDSIFEDPLALAMVIDIFSERGYRAVANVNRADVPSKVDLQTGEITLKTKKIFRFQIRFAGSEIRRGED
ncbi:MAG: nucleoside monophosphate kinase [bacterium]|nr:nucleoside monophosphate kinase [bacterium]